MPQFAFKSSHSHIPPRPPPLPEPGLEVPASHFPPISRKRNPYRERTYASTGWPRPITLGQNPDWPEDDILGDVEPYDFKQSVTYMPGDEFNDTEIWRPLSNFLANVYGRPPFPVTGWPEWIVQEYYRVLQGHEFATEVDDWLMRARSQTIVCETWLRTLVREDVVREWWRLEEAVKAEMTVERDKVKAALAQTRSTSEEAVIYPDLTSEMRLESKHRRSNSQADIPQQDRERSGSGEDPTDHDCLLEQHSPKACRESRLKREGKAAEVRDGPMSTVQPGHAPRTYRNFRLQKEAKPKSKVRFEDELPAKPFPIPRSPLPSASWVPLPPTPGAWPDSEESSPANSDPPGGRPDPAYMQASGRWAEDAKQHELETVLPGHPSPGGREYHLKLHSGNVAAALEAYRHGRGRYATTADRSKTEAIKELAEMRARADVA